MKRNRNRNQVNASLSVTLTVLGGSFLAASPHPRSLSFWKTELTSSFGTFDALGYCCCAGCGGCCFCFGRVVFVVIGTLTLTLTLANTHLNKNKIKSDSDVEAAAIGDLPCHCISPLHFFMIIFIIP